MRHCMRVWRKPAVVCTGCYVKWMTWSFTSIPLEPQRIVETTGKIFINWIQVASLLSFYVLPACERFQISPIWNRLPVSQTCRCASLLYRRRWGHERFTDELTNHSRARIVRIVWNAFTYPSPYRWTSRRIVLHHNLFVPFPCRVKISSLVTTLVCTRGVRAEKAKCT